MEEKGKGRRSEEQAREGFSREEEEKGLIMRKKGNVAGREEEEKEGDAREYISDICAGGETWLSASE